LTSGNGAGLAQHLADVRGMRLFGGDLHARVLLQHDVAAGHQAEELVILGESLLLVRKRLAQDLIDVMLVSLQQRPDLERGVPAEAGDVLAAARRRSGCGCARRS
jgi:hypothetical protein